MTHYIFINGPPKSGRTKIAEMLWRGLNSRTLELCTIASSLSMPLIGMFRAGLAQPWEQLDDNTPRAVLNGLSGHEALRKLRAYLMAVYGPDVLGRWLEHRILAQTPIPRFVVVDDLLFRDDFIRFNPLQRTLIHTGKNPIRKEFVWLPDPDFVMDDHNDLGETLKQARAIVEKLDA